MTSWHPTTKLFVLCFSALYLLLWLPSIRVWIHGAGSQSHLKLTTVFHNETAVPLEAEIDMTGRHAKSIEYQHAYVFHATEPEHACSVLVNIDRLRKKFNSDHRIILIAKPSLSSDLLARFVSYDVTIIPYQPPSFSDDAPQRIERLLKLASFRLHQYIPSANRILVLSPDQLILRPLDHLFSLPSVDLAAPRAYWRKDPRHIASTLMLIKLSDRLWDRVNASIEAVEQPKIGQDTVDSMFRDYTLTLPGDYSTLNSHLADIRLPSWYESNEWKLAQEVPQHRPNKRAEKRSPQVESEQSTPASKRSKAGISETRQLVHVRSDPEHFIEEPTPDLSKELQQQQGPIAGPATEAEKTAKSQCGSDSENYSPGSSDEDSPEHNAYMSLEDLKKDADTEALQLQGVKARKQELSQTLTKIYSEEVKVLSFAAVGKPWNTPERRVHYKLPEAHHLLGEYFRIWRMKAKQICPGFEDIEY